MKIANTARRAWDDQALTRALILLKSHSVAATAQLMGRKPNAVRHALTRAGVSIRAMRQHYAKPNKHRPHDASKAFVSPDGGINSELAQMAFEAKPANGCSWPIGDLESQAFSFCGRPRKPKRPYCAACCKRAYIKPDKAKPI